MRLLATDFKDTTFDVSTYLDPDGDKKTQNYFTQEGTSPIENFGSKTIDFALSIMATIAVILIIVAGFYFMTARGDSEQIEKGKEIIKYALGGLAIAFLAYIMVIFVQAIFPAT